MLRAMIRLAVVVFVVAAPVLADIAPARLPPECSADSQCVITTFDGCCGSCCPRAPYAMSAARLQAAQGRCAAVKCARPSCEEQVCAAVVPEPASNFRAVCEAGRCVAKLVAAECRNDSDCTVAQVSPPAGAACYAAPCGCCPTNVAVPVEQARPPPPPTPTKTPPPKTKGGQPAFGLSTGTTGTGTRPGPEPASCAPCPQPPPASSACVAGKCTLVPPRPQPRPLPPG